MSALALDRQAIEKKDFPISRRGYEPEAVDLHLEALAGEVTRLQGDLAEAQRSASTPVGQSTPPPARKQSLALAASEQVRLIVEAAESSAADIERTAQEDAARIRADADADARRTRDDAVERSEDQVGSITAAASSMLQRVDAMEGELSAIVESLRTGTNRLTADLSLLQGNLGDLYGAAGSTPAAPPAEPVPVAFEEEPLPEPALEVDEPGLFASTGSTLMEEPELGEPVDDEPGLFEEPGLGGEPELTDDAGLIDEPEPIDDPVAPEAELAPDPVELEPERVEPEPLESEPAPTAPVNEGDVEGARLIALNMALNGQSREETDQYLSENFDLGDRASLLDEVYATVEG